MRSRLTRFLAVFSAFAAALLFLGGFYISTKTNERINAEKLYEEKIKETKARDNARGLIIKQMETAYTVSEWEALVNATAKLGDDSRLFLDVFSQSKLLEKRFFTQEKLLVAVRKLLSMNENDPVAQRYLHEAQKIHEANIKALADIPESFDDCAWNAELNYLKGSVYYRGLAFLKAGENAKGRNLISQSLESFKKVFKCFPKDNDAEVAIEVLYKPAESFSSGSAGQASSRLHGFPSGEQGEQEGQGPGTGQDGPGAGGRDRERGRH